MPDIHGTTLIDIGWRIRVLREALGYTNATQFQKWVGLTSAQQLSNYERGQKRPEISMATKICVRTGCTLDWIYRGERAGLPYNVADAIQSYLDRQAAEVERA